MNGLLLIGGVLLLALFVWLAVQWFMAPVLSGNRHHDFGLVRIPTEGPAYVTHVFRLENHSGRPLKIKRAVPSCGCTSVDYFDPDVPVDGVVEIPVVLKLKRSARERSKVTLTFDEASPMTLHVEGVGRLENPLIIEPPVVTMRPGQSRPVSLTVQFWENGSIQYPVVKPAEGMKVTEGRWKKVRQFDPDTGVPGLTRMTFQLSLPGDFAPGQNGVLIEMANREFTLPVMIRPGVGRGPDVEKDETSDKVYDPLKRTMLQENPEDEVPVVVGTNSSAIPSR
tara:strand:+ start:1259 stop:2101 length:843 start_codon:yes stop_codon:yes gene_type:complete